MASTSRLLQLAETISASVAQIQKALDAHNLPAPSFDEDARHSIPLEAADAQDAVLDAAAELQSLLLDPMTMMHHAGGHNNSVCQQAIAHFGIAALVPAGGQISYADLAKKTSLSEQTLTRLVRHAVTMHIFREPEPGFVAHTAASKILADPMTNDWLRVGTGEMWPAAVKTVHALEKWPGSEEFTETGFALANNNNHVFAVLGSDPERGARFGRTMAVYSMKPENSPAFLTDYYDWAALGAGAKVIHLGGGMGQVATALVQKHTNLEVVVQDVEMMFGPGAAGLPEDAKNKVTFEAHELFAPQSVPAAVYLFRWNLRTWSDKYALLALKAQVPALKPGARVLIQDVILPEPWQGPLWKQKDARSHDLSVLAAFNARDRTVADWKALLQEADKGFTLKSVSEPKGSALGLLEFVWEESA